MSPLTENQLRSVVSTFRHVDRILENVARLAEDEPSPLARRRPDLLPSEARLLRSHVARLRSRLLSALDRLGIARPEPEGSARWAIETALRFARISLSDMLMGLRGYGEVDREAAAELEAVAAELEELLSEAASVLREGDPRARADRPAGPEA